MKTDDTISIALFTKNWAGKAMAAHFSTEEAERAQKAAAKHAVSFISFTNEDNADFLAALPVGRFGENDRPLLTAIKQDMFKRLSVLADLKAGIVPADEQPTTELPESAPPTSKKTVPMAADAGEKTSEPVGFSVVMKEGKKHWPHLKMGDIVLTPELGDDGYNGWWEAVVKARSETHVTLDWLGYPDLATFTRPITQITLRHPECKL